LCLDFFMILVSHPSPTGSLPATRLLLNDARRTPGKRAPLCDWCNANFQAFKSIYSICSICY
jgi:hypothetical protein